MAARRLKTNEEIRQAIRNKDNVIKPDRGEFDLSDVVIEHPVNIIQRPGCRVILKDMILEAPTLGISVTSLNGAMPETLSKEDKE